jgi:ATP-dependent 26S proteasome regulatory subunit
MYARMFLSSFSYSDFDFTTLGASGQNTFSSPITFSDTTFIFASAVIVKASSGPRYVVGCRAKIDRATLKAGSRVALDITTYTIMRKLPREVDPVVYNMTTESAGDANYAGIGGLTDQIRELREVRDSCFRGLALRPLWLTPDFVTVPCVGR